MFRPLGVSWLLFLVPVAAAAEVPRPLDQGKPPEALLAKDSMAYFRFDGVAAHRGAYEQTALAQVLDGDLRALLDQLGDLIRDSLARGTVKDKLFAGLP